MLILKAFSSLSQNHLEVNGTKVQQIEEFSWEIELCWRSTDKDYSMWGAGEDSLHGESKNIKQEATH